MADELPTSLDYEAQISGLEKGLAALPGIYNPQRQRLAYERGRGLEESGLYDVANIQANPADPSGNITWVVFRGPQGRLYRQAFTAAAGSANQAGSLFSSTAERARRQAGAALDTQGTQDIRSFEGAQTDLTNLQLGETREQTGKLEEARGKYADWRAAQKTAAETVPTPPEPPATPDGTPTPDAAPPTPNLPAGVMKYADWIRYKKLPGGSPALADQWRAYVTAHGGVPPPKPAPPPPTTPVSKSTMGPYGPTGIPVKGYAIPIRR